MKRNLLRKAGGAVLAGLTLGAAVLCLSDTFGNRWDVKAYAASDEIKLVQDFSTLTTNISTDSYTFACVETYDGPRRTLTLNSGYKFRLLGDFSGVRITNYGTILETGEGGLTDYVDNHGEIAGGLYYETVYNLEDGVISGGTMDAMVYNDGVVTGGYFECGFRNVGTISGGTFDFYNYGSVVCESTGIIEGGTFKNIVDIAGVCRNGDTAPVFWDRVFMKGDSCSVTGGEFYAYIDTLKTSKTVPASIPALVLKKDGSNVQMVAQGDAEFRGMYVTYETFYNPYEEGKLVVPAGSSLNITEAESFFLFNDIDIQGNLIIDEDSDVELTGTSFVIGPNGKLISYGYMGLNNDDISSASMKTDIDGEFVNYGTLRGSKLTIDVDGSVYNDGRISLINSTVTGGANWSDNVQYPTDLINTTVDRNFKTFQPKTVIENVNLFIPLFVYGDKPGQKFTPGKDEHYVVAKQGWLKATATAKEQYSMMEALSDSCWDNTSALGEGYRSYVIVLKPNDGYRFRKGYTNVKDEFNMPIDLYYDMETGYITVMALYYGKDSFYKEAVAYTETETTITVAGSVYGPASTGLNSGWEEYDAIFDTSKDSYGTKYTGYIYEVNIEHWGEEPVGRRYVKKFTVTKQVYYLPAPVISKVTNIVDGVRISWNTIKDATSYKVYRLEKGKDSAYTYIGTTTATNYKDSFSETTSNLKSGKTYSYQIMACRDKKSSDLSKSVSTTFVGTPDITTRVNSSYGIRIYWDKIEGATGYAIYRKDDVTKGDWVRVATITDPEQTNWTDADSKSHNGTVYHYTIRALAGSDRKILSGCRSTGRTMVRLFTPTVSSAVKASANSITATWNYNNMATGYEYRIMCGSKVITSRYYGDNRALSRTLNDLPAGKTYQVQVRSVYKTTNVGSYYSAWSKKIDVTL